MLRVNQNIFRMTTYIQGYSKIFKMTQKLYIFKVYNKLKHIKWFNQKATTNKSYIIVSHKIQEI